MYLFSNGTEERNRLAGAVSVHGGLLASCSELKSCKLTSEAIMVLPVIRSGQWQNGISSLTYKIDNDLIRIGLVIILLDQGQPSPLHSLLQKTFRMNHWSSEP